MTTRQELLNQWQQRLTDAEQACLQVVVPTWSDRIRVRLYRFMLAMYGQSVWPGETAAVNNDPNLAARSQVVTELKQDFAGKEPRTRAEIRTGLRNVTGLSEELAPAGPLAEGLLPDSLVIVATFQKQQLAQEALEMLRRRGFAPKVARQGRLVQIYVAAADFAAASAALRENTGKGSLPVRTRSQPVDHSLSLLAGTVFGFAFGLMFARLVPDVLTDWSRADTTNTPSPEQIWGMGIGSVICLLLSFYLCRKWYQQLSSWTEVARSLIYLGAFWLLMIGIGSLSLIFIVTSPYFFTPHPELTPSPETMAWAAEVGATCIVVSVVLLWVRGYLPISDRAELVRTGN